MILKTTSPPIKTTGDFQQQGFSFQSSPHAFKILSDTLYSNKPRAVFRELLCNAWDAHTENGTQEPIEIHLPTSFEPWFSIRDYGPGITHEFMMTGYTVAFNSTKNTSNKQIGGLGLGRLSVLAMTDSYSVTSITDKKRIYTICFQDGLPTVLLLSEEDTEEPTGFQVHAPIGNLSLEKEAKAFLTSLSGVKVKINCEIPKPPAVYLEGKGWRLYEHQPTYSPIIPNNPVVKMGLVRYPIVSSYIPYAQYLPLEIDFPIGSLEITPSRESLSYGEETIKRINARVEQVRKEIHDTLTAKVKTAPSLWEASCHVHTLQQGVYASIAPKSVAWQGKEVFAYVPVIATRYSRRYGRGGIRSEFSPNIPAEKKTCIYEHDAPTYSPFRMRQLLNTHGSVYIVDPKNPDIQNALEGFGSIPKLSSIPYTPPARTSASKTKASYIAEYNNGYWSESDTPFPDGAYYISCPSGSKSGYLMRVGRLKEELEVLGQTPGPIYWLSPKVIGKYQSKGKEFLIEGENQVKKMLDILSQSVIIEDVEQRELDFMKFLQTVTKHPKVAEIVKEAEKTSADSQVLSLLNRYNYQPKTSSAVAGKIEAFLKSKPLLRVLNDSRFSSLIKHDYSQAIKQYIETTP